MSSDRQGVIDWRFTAMILLVGFGCYVWATNNQNKGIIGKIDRLVEISERHDEALTKHAAATKSFWQEKDREDDARWGILFSRDPGDIIRPGWKPSGAIGSPPPVGLTAPEEPPTNEE